jgi:tetratricopeptide (TPR) repeat protein
MTAALGRRHGLSVGAVLLVVLGGHLFADYQDSFRQGVLQHRAQNWNGTVALMRAAIAERANEEGRVRITGNDSLPYLPSYYLGDALMRLGDCPGAMSAFDRARQTAAANNRQWSARMDEVRDSCSKAVAANRNAEAANRSAEAASAIQSAAGAIGDARAVRERIDRYKDREFGAEALGSFTSELSTASGALANADLRLGQAKQGSDAQAAREIERQARTVAKDLASLESRLQDQIRRLAENAATKAPPPSPPPSPPPKETSKDPGAGRESAATPEQMQRLQNAVRLASTALRSAQQAEASYEASRGSLADTPPIQQARGELNGIAETVNRGTRASEAELTTAIASAHRIRDVFSRARDAALSRDLTEAAQAVERLLSSAAGNLDTLEQLARPAQGRRAALDAQVLAPHQRELARLRASLGGGAAKDPGLLRRTLGSATTLDQTLSDLVATYGQQATAASGVPADLLEGARTYFAGRYADAASQLGGVQLPADSPPAVRLQMHLLRAAAAFAAWALEGERDEGRRQAAAREVAECRRIDPDFTPDPAVFSPRFIRFFRGH